MTHRRAAHLPASHLRGSIRARAIPSRRALIPNLNRQRALDRLYLCRLLLPGAQSGQLEDAQIRARRRPTPSGSGPPAPAGGSRAPSSRSQVLAPSTVCVINCVNTDDKPSVDSVREEKEKSIDFAEPVMSEKAEYLGM
jgi:hypothetical protein